MSERQRRRETEGEKERERERERKREIAEEGRRDWREGGGGMAGRWPAKF